MHITSFQLKTAPDLQLIILSPIIEEEEIAPLCLQNDLKMEKEISTEFHVQRKISVSNCVSECLFGNFAKQIPE